MEIIRVDCAKGGCRDEASQVCNRCKTAFCGTHVNNHENKGQCSIR